MSYMRGDLLTRTRKLVKGLAKATPVWLKAMEEAPPVVFPRTDGKIKKIELPEDVYVSRFFKKHPNSLYYDAVRIGGFDPPPARVFARRVLELKGQGVSENEAMALADMEYRSEKKARKKAYKELKDISILLDKDPPPNPYKSLSEEFREEEDPYLTERFTNPKILEIAEKMKEERAAEEERRGIVMGRDGPQQQGGDSAQHGQWNQHDGDFAQRGQWNQQDGGWRGNRFGGDWPY